MICSHCTHFGDTYFDASSVFWIIRGQTGYLRMIDESGEGCLYPMDYFILIELPQALERAFVAA
jgi:hypothetical protein